MMFDRGMGQTLATVPVPPPQVMPQNPATVTGPVINSFEQLLQPFSTRAGNQMFGYGLSAAILLFAPGKWKLAALPLALNTALVYL